MKVVPRSPLQDGLGRRRRQLRAGRHVRGDQLLQGRSQGRQAAQRPRRERVGRHRRRRRRSARFLHLRLGSGTRTERWRRRRRCRRRSVWNRAAGGRRRRMGERRALRRHLLSQTGEPRRQLRLFAGSGGQTGLDGDPLEGRRPPAQPRRPARGRYRGKVPRVRPLKTRLRPRQKRGRRRGQGRRRGPRSRSERLSGAITPVRRSGSAPARELEHLGWFESLDRRRRPHIFFHCLSGLVQGSTPPRPLWRTRFQISCARKK